jgi:hypothetical protein
MATTRVAVGELDADWNGERKIVGTARAAKARTTKSMPVYMASLLVLVVATQVCWAAAQDKSNSDTPTAPGMWCYTSAGVAKQCEDGVQSCVTFVELGNGSYRFGGSSGSDNESDNDKVTLENATATCADVDLAQETGIVCDGAGVQVTSTAAFAYECCRGDLCNEDTNASIVRLKVTNIDMDTSNYTPLHPQGFKV